MLAILRWSSIATGSYCRVVGGKGYKEEEAESWEKEVVTPAGRTEGALHGEACRMFFFLSLLL